MFHFTLRVLVVLAMAMAVSLPRARAAQDATRGQRVSARTATGELLDLYDESHALVIGVSDYNRGWRRLPGVKSDVPAVSAVLKQQGFTVTTLLDPAVEDFERAMRAFISAHGLKERNRLVIYFAGHGHTERLGDDRDLGYIVMRNAPRPDRDQEGFSSSAISMDQMNAYATRIKSKHALFVFDSCFSGSIFRSDFNRRPARIESKSANPVRQFITSGNAGQEVQDDSIFRRYFVRAFEGEGDLDGDGYVTGEELGIFLSGRVASDTNDTQTPRYGKIRDARLNIGDVVFVLPKKELPKPPDPIPTPVADRCAIAWDSIRNSESEQTIESFLAGCKDSPQAFAANLRLGDLRARRRTNPPNSIPSNPTPPALTPVIALPAGVPVSALRSAPVNTASVDSSGRVTRRQAGPVQFYQEDLGGGVNLEMAAVPSGRFQMGSPGSESGRDNDETQHWVRVGDFWMGRYEVTQAQWKAVMGGLPPNMADLGNEFKGDDLPVVRVSWEEAQEFIKKLNARLNGANYRLPREAEWEFAARAGSTTPFGFGATVTPGIVNYDGNYPYGNAAKGKYQQHPVKVGSLGVANAFGLFDLHGNVWEWCEDWYGAYPSAEVTDPVGPSSGSARVSRGGGWYAHAVYCRSADRNNDTPGDRFDNLGFRLLRTLR